MNTAALIEVFKDTMNAVETEPELIKATEGSRGGTTLYKESFYSPVHPEKSEAYNVRIVQSTSFKCARSVVRDDKKTAVLNFANPFKPGGGVKHGARAQEECLCRCSNLFSCISTDEMIRGYYDYNRAIGGYLFTDRIIYTPAVTVFKDDDTYERLTEPFRVDVITCAAPYNVYGHDIEVLRKTYEERLTNIFEVAAYNGVDILILGAFGCGAFHNPPELMAQTFGKLIEDKYYRCFEQIIFALKKPSAFDVNYDVFSRILGDKGSND